MESPPFPDRDLVHSQSARDPPTGTMPPPILGQEHLTDALLHLTHRIEQMQRTQDANFLASQAQMQRMQQSLTTLEFENAMLRKRLGGSRGADLVEGDFAVKLRSSCQTAAISDGPALPTLAAHLAKIHTLLDAAPGAVDPAHAFFLSHYQAEAADVAGIYDLQMKIRGYKCWYDQDATHITESGMLEGIRSSAVFLLILTRGVFSRPWCLFEIRSAVHLRKPIQLLHEADASRACYADLQQIIDSAPGDLKDLFREHESLPFRRKVYEQQALLDRLLLNWAEPLEALDATLAAERPGSSAAGGGCARADEAPSVLADADMAKIVYGGGGTSQLFVDLGTGQMAFKLLGLDGDGALVYADLLTVGTNLRDVKGAGTPERAEVEKLIRGAADDVVAHVEASLGTGEAFEDRFAGVRCGATQWYRDLGAADLVEAEPLLAWLRNALLAGLPPRTKYEFEALSGTEEASLEWISVKNAMRAEFADAAPHASLSGGKGSVQTSMEGGGGHGAHHLSARVTLKEGTQRIEEGGGSTAAVDAWRARVKDQIAAPFGPLRHQLARHFPPRSRRPQNPLRLICSSGFFYLAVAADVIGRKDPPRYLTYDSDVRPRVLKLCNDPDAKPMDRANGVRFLKCLDFLTSDDPAHVELLFAREWLVRKKPYRVTWSTGAFIQYLAERYYTITGEVTHK